MKHKYKIIVVVVVGVVSVVVGAGLFGFSADIKKIKQQNVYQVDGIVILTGGQNRIPNGLELLEKNKNAKLLISGVNPETNEDDIKKLNQSKKELFECCVDIGHNAKNTKGNAKETKQWAEKNNIKSLVIVTSDYHIPRAMLEFERQMPGVVLYAHPVRGEEKWNTIITEFLKYYTSLVVGT